MFRIRAAAALLDHRAGGGLGRHDRAAHVELHDPVPVGARVGLGGVEHLAGAAADGVDEDVDPAEALDGLARPSARVGLVGRVGDDARPSLPGGLDPLDRRVERLLRPARDGDLGAGPGEGLGQRRADAAAAARDEGDAAVEAEDVELAHPCSFERMSLIDYRVAMLDGREQRRSRVRRRRSALRRRTIVNGY